MSLLYAILNCGNGSSQVVSNSYNKVVFIGDSIVAAFSCRPENISDIFFTPAEISAGKQGVNLAVPGNTILQQQTAWTNDIQKSTYDAIVVMLGLNDMTTDGETVSAIITRYQTLINTINVGKKAGAKILINVMSPAKSRFIANVTNPTLSQSKYLDLNNSIMNTFSTNITGVDFRNNAFLATIADNDSSLKAIYDCGDLVHTTSAANVIIKNTMRTAMGI